jgi:hypothetical protein
VNNAGLRAVLEYVVVDENGVRRQGVLSLPPKRLR